MSIHIFSEAHRTQQNHEDAYNDDSYVDDDDSYDDDDDSYDDSDDDDDSYDDSDDDDFDKS